MVSVWLLALTLALGIPAMKTLESAKPPRGKEITKIKILQYNILYNNKNFREDIKWMVKQKADIIILQEINRDRATELRPLIKYYPWSKIKINKNRDAFGMAIFSSLPVNSFRYININDGWNKYSVTDFFVSGQNIRMYELHTPPPMSKEFFEQRNINLELMAKLLEKDRSTYRILIGDFNSTIYSPYLQNVIKRGYMNHSQQGFNLSGTWPKFMPSPFRIAIDHLFTSKQIEIVKRSVLPYGDSDHLPVLTELKIYKE